jgi:putative acetyltransferase
MISADGHVSGNVAIRSREPKDCEGLYALFNEPGFRAAALMRDAFSSAEEVNLWLDGIVTTRRFEIVAVRDDRCVGFGAVYVHGDHFDHCGSLMLGVQEACRGQGIGSLLLKVLVTTAWREARLSKIQLTVLTNNVGAINLYRRHGFQAEGLHRRYARRGETYADAFSMALLLGAAGACPTPRFDAEADGRAPAKATSALAIP